VAVAQPRGDVDGVAEAAEGQGGLDAEGVGDGAGEEADKGKGGVEGGVGVVANVRIHLPAST